MTGTQRITARERSRYSLATLIAAGGCGLFCLCFFGLRRPFFLMEDEGTESWTVNAAPLGIFGCVFFLAILFLFAAGLVTHAVHLFVSTSSPHSRAES